MPLVSEPRTTSGMFGGFTLGVNPLGYAWFATAMEKQMAERVILLSPYNSDKGTVATTDQVTTLPAQNVQYQEPSKVWRTLSAIDQHIDFTLPAVLAVNAVGMSWPQGMLSSSAMFRLLGYADPAMTTALVDSGWKSVWPGVDGYYHGSPDWGYETALLKTTNVVAYRYWRLFITDPGTGRTYFDISRIAVGKATQFRLNPKYEGGISYVALDIQEANGYGQIFTDPRPFKQRRFELSWTALGAQDIEQDAMELARLHGQAKDLFIYLDPAEINSFHIKSMQALFEGPHKFNLMPQHVLDKDNQFRQGWGFNISVVQKL